MSYLRDLFFFFFFPLQFQPHFYHNQSYNLIKTDIFVLAHFLEYLLLFLDNVIEQSK